MDPANTLSILVALWAVALLVILLRTWHHTGLCAGLVLAFALEMVLQYGVGGAIYLLPAYTDMPHADLSQLGFTQSTYGMVAFAVGTLLVPWSVRRVRLGRTEKDWPLLLPWLYVVIGVVSFVVILPVASQVAGLSSVASVGWNLAVVGMAM